MDLARDLIDHRIADLDDQDAGMVDDLWITWTEDTATLGPIVTGTAALLHQLGPLGAGLSSLGARTGWSHANVWREIPWTQIRRIERSQVNLLLRRAELPTLQPHAPHPRSADRLDAVLPTLQTRRAHPRWPPTRHRRRPHHGAGR